jgi:hypothetical protein
VFQQVTLSRRTSSSGPLRLDRSGESRPRTPRRCQVLGSGWCILSAESCCLRNRPSMRKSRRENSGRQRERTINRPGRNMGCSFTELGAKSAA